MQARANLACWIDVSLAVSATVRAAIRSLESFAKSVARCRGRQIAFTTVDDAAVRLAEICWGQFGDVQFCLKARCRCSIIQPEQAADPSAP